MADCTAGLTTPDWLSPSRRTEDTRDDYLWAVTAGVFVEAADIEARIMRRLQGGPDTVLVLDVRDDDAAGGHIAGALHFPDSTFTERLDEVLDLLRARRPALVVLHCMESVRRGPRCARRLRDALEGLPHDTALPDAAAVRVLRGGADRWLRQHWRGPLVAGFDNAYWGWEDDAPRSREPELPGQAPLPTHCLYERPADQRPDVGAAT